MNKLGPSGKELAAGGCAVVVVWLFTIGVQLGILAGAIYIVLYLLKDFGVI